MGLEEILKQVEETGREKAAAIRKDTVDDVESKMKEASTEAKNVADLIMTESSRKIDQLRQQEIPSAELEVKRSQLEIQKELLSSTKATAMSKLENLNSKELKKIYSSLLEGVSDDGKLFCRKKDSSIFKEISKLSHGGNIDEIGFIIESGNFRLDFRFVTLVERAWQDNLSLVSEVLFTK
jgi:V/A-type H+-transporting ATPase subunit E|tara:strand:+ start:205 stop:747 length:543 start_codon:yes stop_codon:yes gene_type:complete